MSIKVTKEMVPAYSKASAAVDNCCHTFSN